MSFAKTRIGFFLQSRADTVIVTVHSADDPSQPIATMAGSGRYITAGNHYSYFSWNGRMTDGQYAPAGTYTFFVTLLKQGRNFPIPGTSVQVESGRPEPKVSSLAITAGASTTPPNPATTTTTQVGTTPASTASTTTTQVGTTPYFSPGRQSVTFNLHTGTDIGADVLVYRASTSASRPLTLVKTFGIDPRRSTASWDGMINGEPAPAGTYLIGLAVTDASCTHGQFPQVLDPAPGTTAGAGVNVSYLSANPPMDPVPSGQLASVPIQSAGNRYRWALRLAGHAKVIFHGTGAADDTLRVRLPDAGLYELTVAAGHLRTTVPLVASAVGARAAAKVLVVLPALSWQGANQTGDDSDGLIDTLLTAGSQISLERPLVAGLPSGVGDEAALLSFLTAQGYRYDVTTDIALAEGVGPSLQGRSGVLLDGTFRWLPSQLAGRLRSFVQTGGGVFTDGIGSLQAKAQITDGNYAPIAGPSSRVATDPFGVTHGSISPSYGQVIAGFTDGLGLFGPAFALQVPRYQVLEPPGSRVATAAGVSETAPSIIGFHLQKGTVVEAGLANFGFGLTSDPDSDELLSRVWQVVLH